MSVSKKDAREASVSGGAVGSWASTYPCNVLAGIVETRACSASGVGGNAGGFKGELRVGEAMSGVGPSPLYAASDGEGVRSCWGAAESTIIASGDSMSDCFGAVGGCCCLREKNENIASGDGGR